MAATTGFVDERIEAFLLLQEVERRRFGGFLLLGQMHALVAAILLRVARLDPLDGDPQPQPPHCQTRQTEEGCSGAEGDTVVRPDGIR